MGAATTRADRDTAARPSGAAPATGAQHRRPGPDPDPDRAKGGSVIRTTIVTTHGVALYCPTAARPYHRMVWRDQDGRRQQRNANPDHDQAWAQAVEVDEQLAVDLADPGNKLVKDLVQIWLNEKGEVWSRAHSKKSRDMASRFILPVLGDERAWILTRTAVQACLATPEAGSARRHLQAAMGSLLAWAYEQDPAFLPEPRHVYMPRSSGRRTAKSAGGRQHGTSALYVESARIPDPGSLRRLAEAMRKVAGREQGEGERVYHRRPTPVLGERAWLMVAVAASCGLRIGELLALTVGQINIAEGAITVDRQVQHIDGGGVEIGLPKWGRRRIAPLPRRTIWGEPLRERLQEHVKGLPGDALVVPAEKGGYIRQSNFHRRWLRPAIDLTPEWHEDWVWHTLRHAFCSLMLRGDERLGRRPADITDLSIAAGHKDVVTTQSMYVSATRGVIGRLNDL